MARSHGFIVTGTDTGIGKTVFAAGLTQLLQGCYWKPIQAGLEDETDSQTVARLNGLPASHVLSEAYKLQVSASPHISAAQDGLQIQREKLAAPVISKPLIIEGAGGLLVPLSDDLLQIEMFAAWQLPIILCARTALGTINHTMLSLEALAARHLPLHGIAFIGKAATKEEETIIRLSGARRLGRLPYIDPLTPASLAQTFIEHFDKHDFKSAI